jgi:hypothetical protein
MKLRISLAAWALTVAVGLVWLTAVGYGQRRSSRHRDEPVEQSIKVDGFWLIKAANGRQRTFLSVPEPKIESDGAASFPPGTKIVTTTGPSPATGVPITATLVMSLDSRQTHWIRLLLGRDLKAGERAYVHVPTVDFSNPVKPEESARVKP